MLEILNDLRKYADKEIKIANIKLHTLIGSINTRTVVSLKV